MIRREIAMDFRKNPKTAFKDVSKLTEDEAREQIEALRTGIEYHDYLYYVKNVPEISDATYDKLLKRLQELEKAFPEFDSENSPTKRVGAKPVHELRKVRHASSMLSLNAVYADEDVVDFDRMVRRETGAKKVEYVAEPKFDGLSVEVVFEEGAFTRGATRGDGQTGEDISRNIRTIHTVPLRLRNDRQDIPSFLAVRGEVFMYKDDFQKLNRRRIENGRETFANPRNAAAGTVRQLDPGEVAEVPLDIVFYDVLEVRGRSFASHWEMLRQLPQWGLRTDPHNQRCASLDQVRKYHARMAQRRDDLDYEVDGIVIKLNDYETREKLGTRQRSPRWALAWKFEPKQDVTVLQDIVVQVGRTGILTPVALLDSVNVGGVTVSRATLHNEDEVRRKDVRPGDKVRIERAGDVIPEVIERVEQPGKKRGKPFSMPGKCPACGTKVRREGAYYYCPASLTCPPQLVARITHYASRDALDIQGLGHETARELVERGMVRTIADLYDLSVDDLKQLEGFAEKSARQLHDAIRKAKKARTDRFVYALGIRDVGEHVAQVLARHFRTLEALEEATIEELEAVEEIGRGTAESIYGFFHQKQNRAILRELHDVGVRVEPISARRRAGPLRGKTFVFTGALEGYTRDEAQRRVEGLGGRATSHVSGNTDYVVVGRDPGSTLDEARKRNIKTVDEREFQELVSV
jgi:DNA ligase (NAD+)